MPPEPTSHPSERELAQYRRGSLTTELFNSVAMHVANCEECRAKVERPVQTYQERLRVLRTQLREKNASTPRDTSPTPGASDIPETMPVSDADLLSREPVRPAKPLGPSDKARELDVPLELTASAKYEVLGKLGKGGMASVWKARHKWLNRTVAVKVLLPETQEHIETRDRFLKEMTAIGKLEHRHIVRAHDAEKVGEALLLVMEYVDGYSLQKLVKQRGTLPVGFSCRAIAQAAEGLQHAHEKGLVHRDIKPQNLMITKDTKEIKILDFGLARLPRGAVMVAGETRAQSFLGTPEFVAPEQANDARSADIRADIYSLGCTLYYLLAGRPPFEGVIPLATIVAHMQEAPQPLPELRPRITDDLWEVVEKMLAKKPEDRYQTPAEVAEALKPFFPGARKDPPPQAEEEEQESAPTGGVQEVGDSVLRKVDVGKLPYNPPRPPSPEHQAAAPAKRRVGHDWASADDETAWDQEEIAPSAYPKWLPDPIILGLCLMVGAAAVVLLFILLKWT